MKKYKIEDQYGNSWGTFCGLKAIYVWIILSLFLKAKFIIKNGE